MDSPYEWPKYFDLIDEGLAFVGRDFRIIRVNPAFSELTGYSKYELEGKTLDSITHPEDIHYSKMAFDQLLGGEVDYTIFVKRYITKTGESVWIKKVVYPIRTDEVKHFFVQAIAIKNGAREQLKKVQNKVEVVEYVTFSSFFKKYWFNIVSLIGMALLTSLGWLHNYIVEAKSNLNQAKSHEERIERLEGKKDLPTVPK